MKTTLTRTGLLTLALATLWVALLAAGRPAQSTPDPASLTAVSALTSGSSSRAAAALPDDFAQDLGYRPRVEDARLVDPAGGCSSPVPLPAEFEGACRQHDLGYDLLRHAAHQDGALPVAARQSLDAQLRSSARASCGAREGISHTWCTSWADIAAFFVRANSVRQHDSAPGPEDSLSAAAMAAGGLTLVSTGSTLVLGGVRLRRRVDWARIPLPRVSGAAAPVLGFLLSISPAHLPHGPLLQGGLTAVIVGACILAVRLLRPQVARLDGRARAWGLVGVLATALGTLSWAQIALSAHRTRIGLAATDPTYWATVAGVVLAAWLAGRGLGWMWARRRVAWRPALVTMLGSLIVFSGGPVHGAPTTPEGRVLLEPSPVGAVRAYAEMREGEVPTARARRAADEMVREGGLDTRHIVIAVPTGSGWINPNLVTGLEDRFGSDVATVGMQYDDAASWQAFLLNRDGAEEGARALFVAVTDRVQELRPRDRPQVHVHGESLGATAGQAIFDGKDATQNRGRVCSVLWSGTPGGHRVGLPRETSVANADDPVVHASPRDLLLPSGDDPRWLPIVSAVHSAADFIGSLEVPDGSGHRYGPEQVDRLATCG